MDTIATYCERRFDGKRTFTLLADAVLLSGSSARIAEFQVRIPLSSLDPNYGTMRVRNPMFWGGVLMVVASFVGCAVMVSGLHMSVLSLPVFLVGLMGMAGFLLCLANVRTVHFVRFTTWSGVVGLDVARSGPERDKFDGFVEALTKQIRVARVNGRADG